MTWSTPHSSLRRNIESAFSAYEPEKGLLSFAGFHMKAHDLDWLLGELGRLPNLMILDMSSNRIGDDGTAALSRSTHLSRLRVLRIGANFIGPRGACQLAKSNHLSNLRVLDISVNHIGNVGAKAIAESEYLQQLSDLHLDVNDIECAGAEALAGSKYLRDLRVLDIGGNYIRDDGATVLATSGSLGGLTDLDLSQNGIKVDGARALANSPHLGALRTLDIGGNEIGPEGADAIVGSTTLSNLRRLDIQGNGIRDPQAVIDLCARLADRRSDAREHTIDREPCIIAFGNPLQWQESEVPISDVTLLETNPDALKKLLIDSRPGTGIEVVAARATLVGLGMSGKTTLARYLVGHPNKDDPTRRGENTVGVEPLVTWIDGSELCQPALGKVHLTVLDCGGQQEQLQSHHNLVYKASGRSLFVLVLRADKDFRSRDGNRADYYLRMLRSYRANDVGDVPVLIVVTHGEVTGTPNRKLESIDPVELEQEYSGLCIKIVDPYRGEKGEDIDDVRRAIAAFLATMDQIKNVLPSAVLEIKKVFEKRFQLSAPLPPDPRDVVIYSPTMGPDEFSSTCASAGFPDESLHPTYARHLAALGVIVAPGIEDASGAEGKTVASMVGRIFNPRYINKHVYNMLMNAEFRRQAGFISRAQFREHTAGLNEDSRLSLIAFLKDHEQVFERERDGDKGLLVPDLLPERQSFTSWSDIVCGVRLSFPRTIFLGEVRFFKFLSQHKLLIANLPLTTEEEAMRVKPLGVFRNEVCVASKPCEALVQIDVIESRLDITVRGGTEGEARQFMNDIAANLVHPEESAQVQRIPLKIPRRFQTGKPGLGKGNVNLTELQVRIERWVEDHWFPERQVYLAIIFGCRPNSLSKIIKKSKKLTNARAQRMTSASHRGRKLQSINGAVLGRTTNPKVVDPAEQVALLDELDAIRSFSDDQVLEMLAAYATEGKERDGARRALTRWPPEHRRMALARKRLIAHEFASPANIHNPNSREKP